MCVDIISALFVPIPEKKITIKSTKRERVHRNKKKIKTKNGKKTFAFPSCAVSHVCPGLPVIPLT